MPEHAPTYRKAAAGGPSGWVLGSALTVLVVAVVALAVVPTMVAERSRVLAERRARLESVRVLLAELAAAEDRQMADLERYASTGDEEARTRYREDRAEGDAYFSQIRRTTGDLSLAFRQQWLEYFNHRTDWQLLHGGLLSPGPARMSPDTLRAALPRIRTAYDRVRAARRRVAIVHQASLRQADLEAQRQREIQTAATIVLALLALVAVWALAVLGRTLRRLARQEEARRREAVATRREIRAILRATGDGVVGVDERGRVTFVNEAAARLLGWSPGDLKGRPAHATLLSLDAEGRSRDPQDTPLGRALKTGETVRALDEVVVRRDGRKLPVQMTATPIEDGAGMRGVVLTFADMTEMRAARDALEEAVRARDDMMAIVSHDLRNPVGTISAAAELLLDIPMPPERQREHLEAMHRSAERMGRLIGDLLDVARIEAGRFAVVPKPVAARTLVEEAVLLMTPMAREHGVRLEAVTGVEGPADGQGFGPADPCVAADRERVLQALENLIANAIRFSPQGGVVRVGVGVDRDAGAGVGAGVSDEVALYVSDEGPGIPPEHRARLFDRFWKGERRGGTGLGLAIVKGITEAHGGRVEVDSEPGRGTTFRLWLPSASALRTDGAPRPTPAAAPPRSS
ncbi:MAG: PAS domain-containing protein [Gemmatimonadetes bacterium]|nr:MAG: PAS domain-containing protein [Gemmatimonadota bacterium]